MANDNLSMRGVTSAASSSSGIDVARLLGKNQSVSGGSADGQFQQVFDAQFNAGTQAASSVTKTASSVSDNSRRSGGNSSPQASDVAQARAAAQARDAQARDARAQDSATQAARQNDKSSRAQDSRADDRRDEGRKADSRKTDNGKTDANKADSRKADSHQDDSRATRAGRKDSRQDERDARNETRHNATTERKTAASTERDGAVKTKSTRNKNTEQKTAGDNANAETSGQTAQPVSTTQEKTNAAGCMEASEVADATVEQALASAKVVDVANSSTLVSSSSASGSSAAGDFVSASAENDGHSPISDLLMQGQGKGEDLSASAEGAGQPASARDLLRALQQMQSPANASIAGSQTDDAAAKLDDQSEAIADPGLKDILTAMLRAKSQAGDASATDAEGKATGDNVAEALKSVGKETMAPSDLLAAVARELAAARQRAQAGDKLPEVSEQSAGAAVNDPSAGPKSAESLLANSNIPVTSLRMGSETMNPALLEKRGREAGLADTQGNTDNSGVTSSSGVTGSAPSSEAGTKIADALTLLMPSHKSSTHTDPANAQAMQAAATPLTLDKTMPALDAAKAVTPPVQADQQMTAMREELRNLGKLVDNGLQAAGKITAREADKDEPGDVKPANLTRAIEDLASVAKTSDVRGANSANSSAVNNTAANNAPVVVGRPNFAEHMAEKILMMTTQKVQTAEIRLDPKELGAVDVKIHVHQDQASVVFSSPHAQVRDALEASIPKLREMFADAGVGLGSVNVNDRGTSAGGGNEQSQGRNDGGNYGAGMDDVVEERTQRAPRESNGLVDFYA